MNERTDDKWKEWEERHKREKSEKNKGIYADLTFCTLWGITIAYSLVIYSWQGYAELQNQATPESTYFNLVAVTHFTQPASTSTSSIPLDSKEAIDFGIHKEGTGPTGL